MRRLLIFLPLFISTILFSLPVNNPASPRIIEEGLWISPILWINPRIGYEGNFILDAEFEKKINASLNEIDHFDLTAHQGTLTFNLLNRLDIYGVFGESMAASKYRVEDLPDIFSQISYETKYDFIWTVGARAVLFEWGPTSLGLGGRYSYSQMPLLWMTKDGVLIDVQSAKLKYEGWQLDLGLSHRIDFLIPYMGIKYSQVDSALQSVIGEAVSDDGSGNLSMKNKNPVGMYLGCGISSKKAFMLNVEVRLIDEEAVTVSGEIRF